MLLDRYHGLFQVFCVPRSVLPPLLTKMDQIMCNISGTEGGTIVRSAHRVTANRAFVMCTLLLPVADAAKAKFVAASNRDGVLEVSNANHAFS